MLGRGQPRAREDVVATAPAQFPLGPRAIDGRNASNVTETDRHYEARKVYAQHKYRSSNS